MSFNNVLVSCIEYALSETDLSKYEDVKLDDEKQKSNNIKVRFYAIFHPLKLALQATSKNGKN